MLVRPHSLYKATAIIPWICDPRVWYPYICPFSKYRIGNTNRVQFTSCNLPLQWFWLRKHLFTSLCLRWGRTLSTCLRGLLAGCFVACPCLHAPRPCIQLGICLLLNWSPRMAASNRKIIRMSAPVSSLPQKNSPPPGEAAS